MTVQSTRFTKVSSFDIRQMTVKPELCNSLLNKALILKSALYTKFYCTNFNKFKNVCQTVNLIYIYEDIMLVEIDFFKVYKSKI